MLGRDCCCTSPCACACAGSGLGTVDAGLGVPEPRVVKGYPVVPLLASLGDAALGGWRMRHEQGTWVGT